MSQDELVDIIDESGNITGTIQKREAHVNGTLHKTVIGLIINSKGEWLLVKQSSMRQDAGQYVAPVGGHVSAGETDEAALVREAEEEMGLTGDFKFEFVGKTILNRHVIGRHENHLFILYKIYSDREPVINHESESYRYFVLGELKKELHDHPGYFGDSFHHLVHTLLPELA